MFGSIQEKLRLGLRRTRVALAERLERLAGGGRVVDDALLDDLEEALIAADVGVQLAGEVRTAVAAAAREQGLADGAALREIVRQKLTALLPARANDIRALPPPRVTLVVGVNGSGKTTTAGKLAARWAGEGRQVVVAAADTFRAAAVEQLVVWAERAGAQVVRARSGADPASVAFDAARAARSRGADDLVVDTAGRLHNKKPLMDELSKIARVVEREIPGAPHDTLLVVDGATGLNAVAQAREFARAVPVTGLVLTKLDGTARGGVAIAIGRELGLPVRFVGVGEAADDLVPFDAHAFVASLLEPATDDAESPA